MNIFITGGTGYIGSLLARKLAERHHTIHALVRNPAAVSHHLIHPAIKLFAGDVGDVESIRTAMRGCQRAFHLAAYARMWARPSDIFFRINVDGTRNVLDAALMENISKLVHTSSTAVFGTSLSCPMSEDDPRTIGFSNDYDLSKCMAEKLVRDYADRGLAALIVNPSRVYGPGNETFSNPFTRIFKRIIDGKIVAVPRCPHVVSNYSYIHDVVRGHVLAMERGRPGQRYILGGENVSYRRFFEIVRQFLPTRLITIPKPLLKTAGACQLLRHYLTGSTPMFTPSTVNRYYSNTAFSSQKAIDELQYAITPFAEGIRETIEHLKDHAYEQQ